MSIATPGTTIRMMSGKYVVAFVLPLKLAADGSVPAREALALPHARGMVHVLARMKQSAHACNRDTAIQLHKVGRG
jgi:hypothetical protein